MSGHTASLIERVALNIANAKRAKHDLPPCRWEHLTDEGRQEYMLYAMAAIEGMYVQDVSDYAFPDAVVRFNNFISAILRDGRAALKACGEN